MAQGGTGVNSIKVTGNVFFNCELQKSFAFIILLCRVFFIVPPHFQCQNETSCLAKEELFFKFLEKSSSGWRQLFFFHFGTENVEEQLKTIPKRHTPSNVDPSTPTQFPVESQICHPP